MNKSYLPSKKIWGLILIIVLVAGGAYFLTKEDPEGGSLMVQDGSEGQRFLGIDVGASSDEWEQALWGDDLEASENSALGDNKTNEVWRDLLPYMLSYLSVEDENKEMSQEYLDELSERISRKVDMEAGEVNRHTKADIDIITNASFEDLDNYFDEFIYTIDRYNTGGEMEDELFVFAQALADEEVSKEMLVGLDVAAADYQSLANELLQISVPESLASLHLELINNYLGFAQASKNMASLPDDPIRAMVGINRYRELININLEITTGIGEEIGRQARLLLESA